VSEVDLIQILRQKVDALQPGDHTQGLRAVLRHIEVAAAHIARGQSCNEESAFTDAIYRTNQAYEGSLKEAYRVIANLDPTRQSPFTIEQYLQNNGILRQRVLDQFTNYRTHWRNPSTHDYKLDFDDGEAFVALANVCAFANVLCDQIAEKLAFDIARTAAVTKTTTPPPVTEPFSQRVIDLLRQFRDKFSKLAGDRTMREQEVVGALHGFLATVAPELTVAMEPTIDVEEMPMWPDMLLEESGEQAIVQVKMSNLGGFELDAMVARVCKLMEASKAKVGVILLLAGPPGTEIYSTDCPFGTIFTIGGG
jgi:hypothetical protein